MTAEEMIKFLKGCAQVGQPEFSRIENALRAAQDMRKAWQDLKELEGFYSPASCAAWDEATKEGV